MRFLASLLAAVLISGASARPDTVCDAVARQVFEFSNQERQRHSVAPLTWNGVLGEAAAHHSQDMCKFDFFSHESPVERRLTPADRVREVGGPAGTCGENIYWSRGYAPDKVPALALNCPTPKHSVARQRAPLAQMWIVGQFMAQPGERPAASGGLALKEWMSDEGHRANLLNPDFHLVGMGVYRQDRAFWVTQVFTD